jgi:hypothetical protein
MVAEEKNECYILKTSTINSFLDYSTSLLHMRGLHSITLDYYELRIGKDLEEISRGVLKGTTLVFHRSNWLTQPNPHSSVIWPRFMRLEQDTH